MGQVEFQNKSTTSTSYDVFWDGNIIVSGLAPGATSTSSTEKAGNHTVLFNVAGTGTTACGATVNTLTQCTTVAYTCAY